MQRRHTLLSLIGIAAIGLAATAACDDSSSSGTSGPTDVAINTDGGAVAPPPATGTTPPPSLVDASVPATGVSVSVVRAGLPLADVRVLFHDAAGAVTGDFKTDATGAVTKTDAPAQLTVLVPSETGQPGDFDLVTYSGIEGGDHLVVDASPMFPTNNIGVAHRQFSATPPGAVDGAVDYAVRLDRTCTGVIEDPTLAVTLNADDACVHPQNALLGVATDDLGIPIDYATKKGLATPALGTPFAVTLGAWTPPTELAVTVANLTEDDVTRFVEAIAIADSTSFNIASGDGDDFTTGFHFPMPPAAFANAQQALFVEETNVGDDTTERALVKRAAAAATMSIDYAKLLPKLTAAAIDSTDFTRPSVTWTSERAFTGVDITDAVVTRFAWLTGDDARISWTLVTNGSAASVKAPQLPADLATVAPNAELSFEGVIALDSDAAASYKDIKKVPFRSENYTFGDLGIPLPIDGLLRLTSFRAQFSFYPPD